MLVETIEQGRLRRRPGLGHELFAGMPEGIIEMLNFPRPIHRPVDAPCEAMRDRKLIATTTVAGLAAVFLWVFLTLPPRARPVDVSGWPDDWSPPTARGVFHVHSDRSDGSAAVRDIAAAAARAGLQFVIFTDHGDGTRAPDPPIYESGVLCIDAVEISTSGGHYIALGLPVSPYPLAGEPRAVVEDVRRLGGFGIVAHPVSAKADLGWTDFGLDYDGIEWLNGDSQWRDESRRALGGAIFRYLLRPSETLAALLDRPGSALARWDERTRRRQVVALAGADAHAHLGTGGGRKGGDSGFGVAFPGYERVFRVFSINVELERELAGAGAAAADATLLLAGIRAGRVFTAIDMVAAPARFSFEGRIGDRRYRTGTRVKTDQPVALAARVAGPPGTRIVLLAGGDVVAAVAGGALNVSATRPGAYRVEVFVPGAPGAPAVPWIVSNPIYVGAAPMTEPSPDPPATASTRALSIGAWGLEHDTRGTASLDHLVDRVVLDYELTGPPPTAAAIVYDLQDAVLDGLDGVAFDVRADRPTRASVQLKANDGPGELRWRRSFYADETTVTVEMRFADLLPITPDMPPPDLAGATSLLIVVDALHTPLGLPSRLAVISPRLVGNRP